MCVCVVALYLFPQVGVDAVGVSEPFAPAGNPLPAGQQTPVPLPPAPRYALSPLIRRSNTHVQQWFVVDMHATTPLRKVRWLLFAYLTAYANGQ